ncbi:MAG: phosphoenolpyruvate synthase [Gammaproteobacteria bacterium]|nr:MAG: phosphoenolpyruvate synthase [Gammaproteobacteria bacterium]
MRWIYTAEDNADIEQIGAKAAALSALAGNDVSIPDWFVVSPAAFDDSLSPDKRRALGEITTTTRGENLLADIEPAESIMQAVLAAYDAIAPDGARIAVRSSAIDEDGLKFSFAGQLESYLQIERETLALHIGKVWQSAFSPRLIAYRRQNGLTNLPLAPAVLIQRMVDADCAGVAFAADPVSGRRAITLINVVAGTADRLVSGEVDSDCYRIDNRTREIEFPQQLLGPRLAEKPVRDIQHLAQTCSEYFERPQDIEWAMSGGSIHLLQSRPITTLENTADPDGRMRLWDNSNIVESYGGITSPLTYSFARGAYQAVYCEFARLLGMTARRLQQHRQLYANMLGYIQGRVYYNLLNWYRALALLPGFSINRKFMEQMMGVNEGLPEEIVAELDQASLGARINDGFQLARTLFGLWSNYIRLPAKTRRFYQRLDAALANPEGLQQMRLDELGDHYRELEQRLLLHWDAPLINDLFAMIFHGLLHGLAQKWCGESLDNDLLCAQGGLVSAEPARRIGRMAEIAAADSRLLHCLQATSEAGQDSANPGRFAQWPAFASEFEDYLERFGDRCLEELKLESSTTRDDPRLLLTTVTSLAQRIAQGQFPPAVDTEQPAREAESRVERALRRHPLRRFVFARVLKIARRLVRERENLRFERTRVFGRVRRIVLEMGKRLVAANRIEQARDVFYLEIEELLGTIEGTATTTRLTGLIALRKRNQDDFRNAALPDERFQTFGAVQVANAYRGTAPEQISVSGETLQGTAACPGVVEGIVRCIDDPKQARLEPGEILVAQRTDPGWVMLFAGASGVLVERGSLLSHSAIVTRELGIPSIVALPGLTGWLRDGDRVRFDGSSGLVERLAADETRPAEKATLARETA